MRREKRGRTWLPTFSNFPLPVVLSDPTAQGKPRRGRATSVNEKDKPTPFRYTNLDLNALPTCVLGPESVPHAQFGWRFVPWAGSRGTGAQGSEQAPGPEHSAAAPGPSRDQPWSQRARTLPTGTLSSPPLFRAAARVPPLAPFSFTGPSSWKSSAFSLPERAERTQDVQRRTPKRKRAPWAPGTPHNPAQLLNSLPDPQLKHARHQPLRHHANVNVITLRGSSEGACVLVTPFKEAVKRRNGRGQELRWGGVKMLGL